jgi:hypothetical protein
MNRIRFRPMCLNCSPTAAISLMFGMSVVRDFVAAFKKRTSRSNRVSVPLESTLATRAPMNACWRLIRPMSLPSPTPWRTRT